VTDCELFGHLDLGVMTDCTLFDHPDSGVVDPDLVLEPVLELALELALGLVLVLVLELVIECAQESPWGEQDLVYQVVRFFLLESY
jgi:hypothetical protein